MTSTTSVAAPEVLKRTVLDLSPLPVTIAIPETEPVSLTRAFLVSGSKTLLSAPVPEISKRTVLSTVAGTNASSALPDMATSPSRPRLYFVEPD